MTVIDPVRRGTRVHCRALHLYECLRSFRGILQMRVPLCIRVLRLTESSALVDGIPLLSDLINRFRFLRSRSVDAGVDPRPVPIALGDRVQVAFLRCAFAHGLIRVLALVYVLWSCRRVGIPRISYVIPVFASRGL